MRKFQRSRSLVLVSVILAALLLGGAGCSKHATKMAVGPFAGPLVEQMMGILLDTSSAQLLAEGMPSNVLLITAVAELSDTRDMYANTCMLYASYGMMVEDDDAEYAQQLFAIGKDFGMRGLMTDSKFKKGIEAGKKAPELVDGLDARFAPCLAWTGLATGMLIIHNMDDPMALMGLPDAVAFVKRSVALDGDYFFGVGKAFLGAYYALMPAFLGLGGGPEASAEMFDEARAVTDGKFLMVDVFEARYLFTYIDDQEAFVNAMETVLATPSDVLKGGEAMNDLAKVKARYYMSIMDTLF